MASTEERLRQLVSENLEVDGKPLSTDLDLTAKLMDSGVTSMEVVAFARVVQEEFGVKLAPEDCNNIQNLAQLIDFLNAQSA